VLALNPQRLGYSGRQRDRRDTDFDGLRFSAERFFARGALRMTDVVRDDDATQKTTAAH